MQKNIIVSCPHCGFEGKITTGARWLNTICDMDEGGCDTLYFVGIETYTRSEVGKNIVETVATARKIEGIERIVTKETLALNWVDFTVIQHGDGTIFHQPEVIMTRDFVEIKRQTAEATGGNFGVAVIARFQAQINRENS